MTLKELGYFYRLTQEPHISRLSKTLGISQSAISLSIKSLESKLGEKLFDRIGKRLVVNERGRAFRDATHPHYQALMEAKDRFASKELAGTLKIIASKTTGNFLLPQVIYDFLIQNPRSQIEKSIQNSATIIKNIEMGTADIGIIESEFSSDQIVAHRLGADRLAIVTSDIKLKDQTRFIDQLFEKKWLLRERGSGTRELFLHTIGALAKDLDVVMEFEEFEEAKEILIANPETITCISKSSVLKELDRGELYEVTPRNLTFKRTLYLIHHKDKYPSALFNHFVAFVMQGIGKQASEC